MGECDYIPPTKLFLLFFLCTNRLPSKRCSHRLPHCQVHFLRNGGIREIQLSSDTFPSQAQYSETIYSFPLFGSDSSICTTGFRGSGPAPEALSTQSRGLSSPASTPTDDSQELFLVKNKGWVPSFWTCWHLPSLSLGTSAWPLLNSHVALDLGSWKGSALSKVWSR